MARNPKGTLLGRIAGRAWKRGVEDPLAAGGRAFKGGSKALWGGAHTLATDPTGQKAAARDMENIYGQQMENQGRMWDEYRDFMEPMAERGRDVLGSHLDRDYESAMPDPYMYEDQYIGQDYGRYNLDPKRYQSNLPSPERYQSRLPDPERFRSGLQAQDYYGPAAQEFRTGIDQSDYYLPEAQRHEFDPFSVEEDAAYQFELGQGQKAINRAAAAGGGTLGPDTAMKLMEYSQGLAAKHGDKAFDRWQAKQGMEYGAERDYRGDIERGLGRRADLDIGQEGRRYGYGRDFRADQIADVGRQMGADIGFEDRAYGRGRDYMGDIERREAQDYGYGRDFRGDIERQHGIDYGMERDYLGDVEREQDRRYGIAAKERMFDYGTRDDYYNRMMDSALKRYDMGTQRAGMGQNLMGAMNPNAQIAGQAPVYQGLAQARAGQSRPAIWDFLNLGAGAAGAAGGLGWKPFG